MTRLEAPATTRRGSFSGLSSRLTVAPGQAPAEGRRCTDSDPQQIDSN
jgi:hypothetical protein